VTGLWQAPLTDRAAVVVAGPEAASFLQNQLTCDVRTVTPGAGGFGALCAVNGRVTAFLRLFVHDGAFVLSLPGDMAAPVRERLARMVFRTKVEVSDAGARLAALGLGGAGADELVAARCGPAPTNVLGAVGRDGLTALRAPGPARFELHGAPEVVREFAASIGDRAAPGGVDAWELAEIESGVPAVHAETTEMFLPQFLDLDRRGGLCFTKGCFPGQEVVARTQHLGEVKRRMFLALVKAPRRPRPGDRLRALHDDKDRDGGAVVRAAPGPAGGWRLLAVVPVAEREAGRAVHLWSADGPRLALEDLPPAT
jgi:hypothetical protein